MDSWQLIFIVSAPSGDYLLRRELEVKGVEEARKIGEKMAEELNSARAAFALVEVRDFEGRLSWKESLIWEPEKAKLAIY